MFTRFKKFSIGTIIALILVTNAVGLFGVAEPAHAQMAVAVTADAYGTAKDILAQVWTGLKVAVKNAAIQLVSYAMRRVAYDSAVWLASGGKGQTPFAQVHGFGDYLKNVGGDAFGAAIQSLGTSTGIDLCKIPDIKANLLQNMGLREMMGGIGGAVGNLTGGPGTGAPAKPTCSWSDFSNNWFSGDVWQSKFSSAGQSLTTQFNTVVGQVSQSDFGHFLDTQDKLNNVVATKVAGAQQQRLEGNGINPNTTKISGDITTPAVVNVKQFTINTPADQQQKDELQLSTQLASDDAIQVVPTILQIFVKNLAGAMVKNFQEKGMLPFGIGCVGDNNQNCTDNSGNVANSYEGSGVVSSRRLAQDFFSSFLDVAQITPADNYPLVAHLNDCPTTGRDMYNCRADNDMVQAVQQADGGTPVTIKDALDPKNHWLHGDWQLIPPSRPENADTNFCKKAYCYSNIKALRQARILPLGFEIAAFNSDPDKPWTLQQVVDGFNNCGASYDPVNYPFCHLIDPNWVIKSPPTRCDAYVPGTSPLSQGNPERTKECVNLTSCVAYDNSGTCIKYGYCTREKNMWRFDGNACDAQFRTCKTYQNVATGQSVSYLDRTLDTGFCTKDNVGCTYYSLTGAAISGGTGSWQGPGFNSTLNTNNGIFLNKNVSNSCSANSAGCSAFLGTATSSGKTFYVKKAPDYLGCYDADPATPGVQWPKTMADLQYIKPDPACSSYAAVCTADEVGCNLYTPSTGGGVPVPGKFSSDNVCPARCVGYDTYREMPSNYSNGQNLAYIIPSSGDDCSINESGCSSFTNVGSAAAAVEYFTYLRPCVPPSVDQGKNYFTYEGGDTGYQLRTYRLVANTDPNQGPVGAPKYFFKTLDQLATFDALCNAAAYKAGTANPYCRQFNDEQGKVYYRLLSQTIPVADNCSQYRLNNTELYTDAAVQNQNDCVAESGYWNITDVKNPICQVCFQNGQYKDGQCYYYGLPGGIANNAGNSLTCSADKDTCREYKGNSGNNIRAIIKNDDFESPSTTVALAGWTSSQPLIISNDSTNINGHSLRFTAANNGDAVIKILPAPVTQGKSYDLTFWARGTGMNLSVSMQNTDNKVPFSVSFGSASIGDAWQMFHLGPFDWNDLKSGNASSSAMMVFQASGGGLVYLDNVRLVELTGSIYKVKKSLQVYPECDSHLGDNLPGEALGCKEYKDQFDNVFDLTGFSFLCREGAIGCTGVLDTQNTIGDSGPRMYRLWIPGAGGTLVKVVQNGAPVGQCEIPTGQSGCYLSNSVSVAPSGVNSLQITDANDQVTGFQPQIVTSTIAIPADTPSSTPEYLVVNKAATCNAVDLGCMLSGKQTQGPTGPVYVTTTIKNDPAQYSNILCESESVGCTEFSSGAGSVYFKDPQVNGNKICTYRTGVTINNVQHDGWFWKGVGVCAAAKANSNGFCSSNDDCASAKVCDKTSQACTTDSDCAGVKCVDACQHIGEQACYPNYIENGTFGLWSYGNAPAGTYQGFVGECPAVQNMCTEFVDHNDVDSQGNPHAYYYLNDGKLSGNDCQGKVSQKEGCALFDETDNPTKTFATADTYALSEQNQSALVTPVTMPPQDRDANVILKVQRDRTCGEWLQCSSSHVVLNDDGTTKTVCDEIGRCDQAPATSDKGDITSCNHWVPGDYSNPFANKPLTDSVYESRDVSWHGMDFSGFSILNTFPLEELAQFNMAPTSSTPDWRLIKTIPCGLQDPTICKFPSDPLSVECISKVMPVNCGTGAEFTEPCPAPVTCGKNKQGVCINDTCLQDINGANSTITDTAPRQLCRAYPESDAPFPYTPAVANRSQMFDKVNRCNETNIVSNLRTTAYECECDYTKVKYGDLFTKYWGYSLPNHIDAIPIAAGDPTVQNPPLVSTGVTPTGFCQGGPFDGKGGKLWACNFDSDCIDPKNQSAGGVCIKKKEEHKYIGWRGFCVEEDESRTINGDSSKHPCLTWYPVDTLIGASDINNQHVEAGYQAPAVGGKYYCLNSNGGGAGTYNKNQADPLKKYTDYYDNVTRADFLTHSKCDRFGSCQNGVPPTYPTSYQYDWTTFNDYGQFTRVWLNNNPQEAPINKRDVQEIIFEVTSDEQSKIGPDSMDPKPGSRFEIWPNDTTNLLQGSYVVHGADGGGARAVTGHFLGKPNEFVYAFGARAQGADDYYLKTDGTFFDGYQIFGNVITGPLYFNNKGITMPNGIWGDGVNGQGGDVPVGAGDICPHGNSGGGNWQMIRVIFDNNGNFTGFDTTYCHDAGGDGGTHYKVTFRLREWCKDLSDVTMDYSQPNSLPAPWTDVLWRNSVTINNLTLDGSPYIKTTPLNPFGSLSETVINFQKPVVLTPNVLPAVKDPAKDHSCVLANNDLFYSCNYNLDFNPVANMPGAPYSCKGGTGGCVGNDDQGVITQSNANTYDITAGEKIFGGLLFARPRRLLAYDGQSYQPGSAYNYTEGTQDFDPKPPQVFSIGQCELGKPCLEGPADSISVNGTSSGNIYLYTANKHITVRFFGVADQNQMPIRNVIVNWGDNVPIPRPGEYRNERGAMPLTCDSKGTKTCLTASNVQYKTPDGATLSCNNDSDCPAINQCVEEAQASDFGHILNRTCDNSYFQYDHTYACSQSDQTHFKPAGQCAGRPDLFPNGCCIYTPAVQIKDNWGWCNGSCNHVVPDGSTVQGCYDNNNNNGKNYDECKYGGKGYSTFKGQVIVAP